MGNVDGPMQDIEWVPSKAIYGGLTIDTLLSLKRFGGDEMYL